MSVDVKSSCLILSLAMTGCVIDTVPLPDITPRNEMTPADGRQFGISMSALYWTDTPTLLVGSEWSVPERVTVAVVNPDRSHWLGTTTSAYDGSFNLPINASTGDHIEVSILASGIEFDTLTLPLEPASAAANEATSDIVAAIDDYFSGHGDAGVAVGSPDSGGIVSVYGPAGVVDQGIAVVVANLSGGNSTAAFAATDGSFHARIAAESGDELAVFAVEPTSSRGGTTPQQVFVP